MGSILRGEDDGSVSWLDHQPGQNNFLDGSFEHPNYMAFGVQKRGWIYVVIHIPTVRLVIAGCEQAGVWGP